MNRKNFLKNAIGLFALPFIPIPNEEPKTITIDLNGSLGFNLKPFLKKVNESRQNPEFVSPLSKLRNIGKDASGYSI